MGYNAQYNSHQPVSHALLMLVLQVAYDSLLAMTSVGPRGCTFKITLQVNGYTVFGGGVALGGGGVGEGWRVWGIRV